MFKQQVIELIKTADIKCLRPHARLVRELELAKPPTEAELFVIGALGGNLPDSFQNLRRLAWRACSTTQHVEAITPFLLRRLCELEVSLHGHDGPVGAAGLQLVQTLPERTPELQLLCLYGMRHSKSIDDTLSRLGKLRDVLGSFLNVLTSLPVLVLGRHLLHVDLLLDSDVVLPDAVLEGASPLHSFNITGPIGRCVELLRHVRLTYLHIVLLEQVLKPLSLTTTIFDHFSESIEEVHIVEYWGEIIHEPANISDFAPLFGCHNITHFCLKFNCNFAGLDHPFFTSMAQAWPNLVELELVDYIWQGHWIDPELYRYDMDIDASNNLDADAANQNHDDDNGQEDTEQDADTDTDGDDNRITDDDATDATDADDDDDADADSDAGDELASWTDSRTELIDLYPLVAHCPRLRTIKMAVNLLLPHIQKEPHKASPLGPSLIDFDFGSAKCDLTDPVLFRLFGLWGFSLD